MRVDPKPQADQVPAGARDELNDELSPSEEEKISGADFLNMGGIKGESTQKPTG